MIIKMKKFKIIKVAKIKNQLNNKNAILLKKK